VEKDPTVAQEMPAPLEKTVTAALVKADLLDHRDPLDVQDPRDPMVMMAALLVEPEDQLEDQDPLDQTVLPAMLAHLEMQESQETTEFQEDPVTKDQMEITETEARMEIPDHEDQLVLQAHVPLAHRQELPLAIKMAATTIFYTFVRLQSSSL